MLDISFCHVQFVKILFVLKISAGSQQMLALRTSH